MDASSDEIDTDKSLFHQLLTSETRDFLVSPSGDQVKVDELDGKTIGLYFSANWYSQCQSFTPVLANIYNQLKEQGARFEIVFVSSDEDQCAFNKFHGTMPWLAIPFSDLNSKKNLTQKFQVEGIPCLIIIDICGKPIQTEGVELIYRYGVQAFPFTQERIAELEAEEEADRASQTLEKLLSTQTRGHVIKQKEQVPVSTLVGKTVGLYFSALACLPCEKFTSKLVSVYENLKEKKEAFEIVFISTDQDESGYSGFYQSMPWHALPYGDETAKVLLKYFNVKGIPSLIIIGPDGKTVTREGRYLINLHKEMAYPFTVMHLSLLQERLDEESKSYPRSFFHAGHHHMLNAVYSSSGGGPFICCECDEQGFGCAYQCIECGFEVHLKCVRETCKDNLEKEHVRTIDHSRPCSNGF
ncbi:probable nucleoredoxin 2 [Telopea speciosissima]|uniref:probable nucleoredoxin 2 n=1 Tax=Telopea speciosissima TaxID=54955 RepID=UPI001CC3F80B|nr:probable nucleoredoxin 2 [Telopea speciosissima]